MNAAKYQARANKENQDRVCGYCITPGWDAFVDPISGKLVYGNSNNPQNKGKPLVQWVTQLVRPDGITPNCNPCQGSGFYRPERLKKNPDKLKRDSSELRSDSKSKWVIDAERSNCAQCNAQFTFYRWRHHCRDCGDIFCDPCCPKPALLSSKRTCKSCLACDQSVPPKLRSSGRLLSQHTPASMDPPVLASVLDEIKKANEL